MEEGCGRQAESSQQCSPEVGDGERAGGGMSKRNLGLQVSLTSVSHATWCPFAHKRCLVEDLAVP
jgi:hypothetical protein